MNTKNTKMTKDYYDGIAHEIYIKTWDKDNHHLGIFEEGLNFSKASKKANENLLSKLNLNKDSNVLDLGSGFGGFPRLYSQ